MRCLKSDPALWRCTLHSPGQRVPRLCLLEPSDIRLQCSACVFERDNCGKRRKAEKVIGGLSPRDGDEMVCEFLCDGPLCWQRKWTHLCSFCPSESSTVTSVTDNHESQSLFSQLLPLLLFESKGDIFYWSITYTVGLHNIRLKPEYLFYRGMNEGCILGSAAFMKMTGGVQPFIHQRWTPFHEVYFAGFEWFVFVRFTFQFLSTSPVIGCLPSSSPSCQHTDNQSAALHGFFRHLFVIGWRVLRMQKRSFKRQSRLGWLRCSLSLSSLLACALLLCLAIPPQPADFLTRPHSLPHFSPSVISVSLSPPLMILFPIHHMPTLSSSKFSLSSQPPVSPLCFSPTLILLLTFVSITSLPSTDVRRREGEWEYIYRLCNCLPQFSSSTLSLLS